MAIEKVKAYFREYWMDAVSYWKAYGDEFEMVLITEAGEIYATESIFGLISPEREVEEITG